MTRSNHTFNDQLHGWFWLPILLLVLLIFASLFLSNEEYFRWLGNERTGILEISQVVLPCISVVLALSILCHGNLTRFSWLWFWIAIAALSSLYIAGEEASWGQHWFLWETSENWASLNDQAETNLHNTSSWFDQKPRLILEIGVIVGGIILPLIQHYKPGLIRKPFLIIVPTLVLMPTAIIAELSRRGEQFFEKLGVSSHLFPRSSEVQELFFALFILLYLILIKQRLNNADIRYPVKGWQ